jgi:hypothetical protein
MWSLPDINRLNATAAGQAAKLKRQARARRKPKCECWNCTDRATVSHLVYDIFSDDPKDVLHLCEQHDGYYGNPHEGYFICDECQRVMVDHYTWERYAITVEDRTLCLCCAAVEHFAGPQNWIDPRSVSEVVLTPGEPRFDSETGVLNLAACPHVLAVKQPAAATRSAVAGCWM